MKYKKLPSLQFVITDQMSLISPLNSNDRSIPLNATGALWANDSSTLEILQEHILKYDH